MVRVSLTLAALALFSVSSFGQIVNPGNGSGSGATIPATTSVLKGDGAGNGAAAVPGTDYVVPSGTVANATTATSVAGGALGSVPAQAGVGTTSFVASPTTTGTYFLGWITSGSAITPTAINLATYLAGNGYSVGSFSTSGTAGINPALNGRGLNFGTCALNAAACYMGGFNLYDDSTFRDGIDFLPNTYRFRVDHSSGTVFRWASCTYALASPTCVTWAQLNLAGLSLTGGVTATQYTATPETVAFSATPTFSAVIGTTRLILAGNVTSSTLAAGSDGAQKTFQLCQDATGSRTFTWPTTVKGGMTIGSAASTCSLQTFTYSTASGYAFWYANSLGIAGL